MNLAKPPEECTICLEDITCHSVLGIIKICRHYYHESCIIQWSNNSNSCPTCRKLFSQIDIKLVGSDHLIRSIKVQDKLLENDAINDIPAEYIIPANHPIPSVEVRHGVCSICSSSDYRTLLRNMISCQSCDASFHQSCLGMLNIQETVWFCPICDFSQARSDGDGGGSVGRARGRGGSGRGGRGHGGRGSSSGRGRGRGAASSSAVLRSIIQSVRSNRPSRFESQPTTTDTEDYDVQSDVEEEVDQFDMLDFPAEVETGQHAAPVMNGGVLARQELRQLETLSAEELKSWELFDRAKEGEDDVPERVEVMSSRRKRKRRQIVSGEPVVPVRDGNSRISNLINQIKQPPILPNNLLPSTRNAMLNAGTGPSVLPIGSPGLRVVGAANLVGSSGGSHGGSLGGSPRGSNGGSPRSSPSGSLRGSPVYSPVTSGDEEKPDLTFDQKNIIQKHIRDRLRPLYKGTGTDKIIRTEQDYITINKAASRKIYNHVKIMAGPGNADMVVRDEAIKVLVKKYVEGEINAYVNRV